MNLTGTVYYCSSFEIYGVWFYVSVCEVVIDILFICKI